MTMSRISRLLTLNALLEYFALANTADFSTTDPYGSR